jgi:3-oxoacyl-(acyl-carrier-protein) synthase
MAERVVVTGCGVVSAIGHTFPSFWSNLVQGVCGIAEATVLSTDQLTQKIVAEVKDFKPQTHFDERQLASLDRVAQFAVLAAREALEHSGLSFEGGLSERTATIIGSDSIR